LHCRKQFDGLSTRVWQDQEGKLWLECGTPDCSGSPIDWAPFPWWEEKYQKTRRDPKSRKRRSTGKRKSPGADDIPF
jgi:hypothetical protein